MRMVRAFLAFAAPVNAFGLRIFVGGNYDDCIHRMGGEAIALCGYDRLVWLNLVAKLATSD